MKKKLGKYMLILSPEMTNGHLEYKVFIPKNATKIYFRYSVGKIWEKNKELVKKEWKQYSNNHPSYKENPKEDEGIRNLITVSISSPSKYFGSSHRFVEEEEIIIGQQQSSPGFIYGEIDSGFWRISINCHAVVSEDLLINCECYCEVSEINDFEEALKIEHKTKVRKDRPLRKIENLIYHKVELHSHTLHSDANFSTSELIAAAKKENIDYLAITDHNTMAPFQEVTSEEEISIIKGMEFTTFFGHVLLHAAEKFDGFDWTEINKANIQDILASLRNKNIFIGVAHPFSMGTPYCTGCQWNFILDNLDNIDYIEVWNSFDPHLELCNLDAFSKWTQLLDSGVQIPATAGRDWHGEEYKKAPSSIYVQGKKNATHKEILESVAMGNTYITAGPELEIKVNNQYSIGDCLPFGSLSVSMDVSNNGFEKATSYRIETNKGVLEQGEVEKNINKVIDIPEGTLYMRVSFFNQENHRVMFTNPFYFNS